MKSKYCTCNIATYKPHCTYCGKQAYEANEGNYPPKTEKIEPLEQCYNDGKHFIVTSTSAVINKLNEVIDHINKKGV
jgi:hypothetical protein